MKPNHPVLVHRRQLESRGHRGPWVALFDIDSTLMDTGPRNTAILKAALDEVPGMGVWKGRVPVEGRSWNVLGPLRDAGVEESLLSQVQAFWAQRFFTDAWLIHDTPYPGVAEFLRDLKAEGFRLAYLTGRHTEGMEHGTRKSFLDHGLPAGPEEIFFFKPTFEMGDRDFKESVCHGVAALGTLVYTVDNEPANCNLFRKRFPEALVDWVDTVTSPHPEPLVAGIGLRTPDLFLDRPSS
jgi:hypothetical protein